MVTVLLDLDVMNCFDGWYLGLWVCFRYAVSVRGYVYLIVGF